MKFPLRFSAWAATLAGAAAGETFRFDAEIGPDRRAGTLHGYAFHERTDALRVLNLSSAPDSRMGDALAKLGAFAGCNGGSVSDNGQPLGLVVADGVKSGTLATDKPGTEGVLVVSSGSIALLPSASWSGERLDHPSQALQGGPFLVANGAPTTGLDADHFARRTVIVTSGKGDWAILYSPSTTLDRLAHVLADGKSFPHFKIAAALNLGGGALSGIWFQRSEGAPALYLREISPSPNALAIIPK
jgi:hypothetical protein